MELHGIRVAAVEDVSVFIFRAKIINPLSNKFITPITEERQAVLGEIKTISNLIQKSTTWENVLYPLVTQKFPKSRSVS